MLLILAAFVVSADWVIAAEQADSPEVTVKAQGLRVVKPAPEGEDMLRAFNWSPGTSVSLLVHVPGGGLIAMDEEASELTMFLDDKRADLRKPEGGQPMFGSEAGFGGMPSISDDGKYCSVEVDVPRTPTPGATRLAIRGKVVLSLASAKKDFTAKGVALEKGTKIEAGEIPLTITKVGKPDWGDAPLAVTFQAKQKLDSLAGIQFLDSDGNEIEASQGMSSSMGMMGNVTVSQSYNFERKVDTCDVVLTYWTDMKDVTVPFEIVLGLGF